MTYSSKLGPAEGLTGAVARLNAGLVEGTAGVTAGEIGDTGVGGDGDALVTAENGV
jgi:hypothetical protein